MKNTTDLFRLPAPISGHKKSNETKQLTALESLDSQLPINPIPNDNRGKIGQIANVTEVDRLKWYAVYTRPRSEKKLYQALKKSGFTAFLPMTKEKRIWSDRIKTVELPLLPSYLFVKLPKNQNHLLYCFPGFVRFVSFEGKCCEINDKEISLLRKIERYGMNVMTNINNFRAGDLVRIVKGPLTGREGKIDRTKGSRVIFHLEGIHQSISVELSSYFVERVK